MWKMLRRPAADNYVIGTGEARSVEEFAKMAFAYANLDYRKYVEIDKRYYRPVEVTDLVADSRKAKRALAWRPKIRVRDLAKIMVDADMRAVGLKPIGEGDRIIRKKFPNRWWKAD